MKVKVSVFDQFLDSRLVSSYNKVLKVMQ